MSRVTCHVSPKCRVARTRQFLSRAAPPPAGDGEADQLTPGPGHVPRLDTRLAWTRASPGHVSRVDIVGSGPKLHIMVRPWL